MPKGPNPQLAALRLAKPDEFRRKVRAAIAKAGSIPAAAEALEVARATLFRWVGLDASLVEGLDLPPPRAVERGGKAPSREKGPKAKATRSYGAVITVPGVDSARFVIAATVFRRDGAAMTRADLDQLAAAMPPVGELPT